MGARELFRVTTRMVELSIQVEVIYEKDNDDDTDGHRNWCDAPNRWIHDVLTYCTSCVPRVTVPRPPFRPGPARSAPTPPLHPCCVLSSSLVYSRIYCLFFPFFCVRVFLFLWVGFTGRAIVAGCLLRVCCAVRAWTLKDSKTGKYRTLW